MRHLGHRRVRVNASDASRSTAKGFYKFMDTQRLICDLIIEILICAGESRVSFDEKVSFFGMLQTAVKGKRNFGIEFLRGTVKLKLNYSLPRVHFHKPRKQTEPRNHTGNQRFVGDPSSGKQHERVAYFRLE